MLESGDYLTALDMGIDNGTGAHIYGMIYEGDSKPGNERGLWADVIFVDYSAFHREWHPELFDPVDGWTTREADEILERLAAERFGVSEIGFTEGDDPHVAFFLTCAAPATAEELGERVWPSIAGLLNETDPGTFGARYLYKDVAAELAAREAA